MQRSCGGEAPDRRQGAKFIKMEPSPRKYHHHNRNIHLTKSPHRNFSRNLRGSPQRRAEVKGLKFGFGAGFIWTLSE